MKINRSSVWTIEISKLLQAIVTSNIKPLVGTCPKVYGSEDCSVLLASDHLPRVTPHFLKSDLLQYLLLFLTKLFFWVHHIWRVCLTVGFTYYPSRKAAWWSSFPSRKHRVHWPQALTSWRVRTPHEYCLPVWHGQGDIMISTSKLGIEPQKSLNMTLTKHGKKPCNSSTWSNFLQSSMQCHDKQKVNQKYQWNIILDAFLMANQPGSSSGQTAGLAFLEDVQTSFVHILAVWRNNQGIVGCTPTNVPLWEIPI